MPPPKLTIASTAPTVGPDELDDDDTYTGTNATSEILLEPPAPTGVPAPVPLFRPLKVYTFGPSRGRARGNIQTIAVDYEKLAPGPVGERISVVDYDKTRECFYDPVDLDDPQIAVNGGIDPSESDPHFHQQMAYAVVSSSLKRIEVALGRPVGRRYADGTSKPLKIYVHPHFARVRNAFSSQGHMMFGYFRAGSDARGRVLPGQTIFTCLSNDVVGHQVTHVVLGAMRPDLDYTNIDNRTLQEALSDLTPLLTHFTNREIVFDTVQRTAGIIYRSQLDGAAHLGAEPRSQAELASDNPLLAFSGEFGDAIGNLGGIRNALLAPDPDAYAATNDAYQRGAIVVAAVFDAMFSIYERRTEDLFRIHRAGGGRVQGNDLPEALAMRLCEEVENIATRFFGMCWRAIDYCPPVRTSVGDFLRACITADYELTRDDSWGLRDALMQAFRTRRIVPQDAPFFSEEPLRWPAAGEEWPALARERATDDAGPELRAFAQACKKELGIEGGDAEAIYPLQTSRLVSPGDLPRTTSSTQIITGPQTGVTLVFDETGRPKYVIPTSQAR